jgi:hypothetical protein
MKPAAMNAIDKGPWYKEPWPWILMTGPIIVIIAGVITAIIAIKTSDGLVTEDYYKKGLAANQTIARSDQATKLGLTVGLRLTSEAITLRLQVADKSFVAPPNLVVTISHPTRAGLDQTQTLVRQGDSYTGPVKLPSAGHWLVLVEDQTNQWRVMGNVILPANGEIVIGSNTPRVAADIRN